MSGSNEIFIARLRDQMAKEGISQQDLANAIGRSLSTAKRICKYGLKRGWVPIFKVSRAVNCSAAYLTGERDDPELPMYLRPDQRLLLELYERLSTQGRRAAMNTLQEAHSFDEKEGQFC